MRAYAKAGVIKIYAPHKYRYPGFPYSRDFVIFWGNPAINFDLFLSTITLHDAENQRACLNYILLVILVSQPLMISPTTNSSARGSA